MSIIKETIGETPEVAVAKALAYYQAKQTTYLQELKDLVSYASVSVSTPLPEKLREMAEVVAKLCTAKGLEEVRLLAVEGAPPYVFASKMQPHATFTLLLYAHYDVQPAGDTTKWQSPPFSAELREGRLYGRGAADDKAGIIAHLAAVESFLKTAGSLPINIKILFEGEEESGSAHLKEFVARYQHLLSADALLIIDATNIDTGYPAITTSLRGLVNVEVTVRTIKQALHSGMWGGPIPDAAMCLSKMLASLVDKQGRLTIPHIYDQVRPLNAVEAASIQQIPLTESRYREQAGILPSVKLLGGKNPLIMNWREPSLNICALQASTKNEVRNILVDEAFAHVSLRIVPDMDPELTLKFLKQALREGLEHFAPFGAELTIKEIGASPSWYTESEHPIFKALSRSLALGFNKEPVFIGCGGSIPLVKEVTAALGGIPALLLGVEDPYSNAHGENESLEVLDLHKIVYSCIHLYQALSQLKG